MAHTVWSPGQIRLFTIPMRKVKVLRNLSNAGQILIRTGGLRDGLNLFRIVEFIVKLLTKPENFHIHVTFFWKTQSMLGKQHTLSKYMIWFRENLADHLHVSFNQNVCEKTAIFPLYSLKRRARFWSDWADDKRLLRLTCAQVLSIMHWFLSALSNIFWTKE